MKIVGLELRIDQTKKKKCHDPKKSANLKSKQYVERNIPQLCFRTMSQKPLGSIYKVMSLHCTIIFQEETCQHPQESDVT